MILTERLYVRRQTETKPVLLVVSRQSVTKPVSWSVIREAEKELPKDVTFNRNVHRSRNRKTLREASVGNEARIVERNS